MSKQFMLSFTVDLIDNPINDQFAEILESIAWDMWIVTGKHMNSIIYCVV